MGVIPRLRFSAIAPKDAAAVGDSAAQAVAPGVRRAGRSVRVQVPLFERLRDPGNANDSVEYDDVVSDGHRMRTLITHPRRPGRHPACFFIPGYSPISYDDRLTDSGLDAPILRAMADSGWVTMRVDKTGVGDSEAG